MGSPDAPDYKGAAEATAASDAEMLDKQTVANRPDRVNPWGTETWAQEGDRWTQNVTLNDDSQAALDSQLALQRGKSDLAGGMMGRLNDEFGDQMDWSQFGSQQGLEFDPSQLRQRAEDAAYGRATSRLDPRFNQGQEALEIKMRNQGLSAGDEAYDKAMANFGRDRNDAYEQAQMGAVGQGRSESDQAYGQQMGSADYANKLRQNSITEEMKKRSTSLNEMNAVLNGQQVASPQFQNFSQAGRSQGVDYTGAANSQANFDQAAQQSKMDAITGMAGAAGGMFSDRRLKRNIKQIGKLMGYPFYIFTYLWGERSVGFMSDEVNQDAVTRHQNGFDFIDLSKLTQKGV
ncbi:MAG: hypothetical protein DRI24_21035 [Deltaproteobacteria bacterium]|nr:MAG: hypothetical protein DRI24_21035 [Deltaproteobacteria bacterium]